MCEKQCEQNLENEQWDNKFPHNLWFIIKCKDKCSNGFLYYPINNATYWTHIKGSYPICAGIVVDIIV